MTVHIHTYKMNDEWYDTTNTKYLHSGYIIYEESILNTCEVNLTTFNGINEIYITHSP